MTEEELGKELAGCLEAQYEEWKQWLKDHPDIPDKDLPPIIRAIRIRETT